MLIVLILLLLLCPLAPGQTAQAIRFTTVEVPVVRHRLATLVQDRDSRVEALIRLFADAGCGGDQLLKQPVRASKTPNVICTIAGDSTETILVGAHYDKVFRGQGAVDNGTGAALLPSLFQSLAGVRRHFTFLFVGFTDEEKGLVGSRHYIKQAPKEEIARIRAMVNLDSLGLSPTKIWISRADKTLVQALLRVAASTNLRLDGVNVEAVGDSDSRPFHQKKVPVIDFHSVTQNTMAILHSDRDRLEAVNMEDYYESYRLLTAFLAYLDIALDELTTAEQVKKGARRN